jgi:hypothetical protein
MTSALDPIGSFVPADGSTWSLVVEYPGSHDAGRAVVYIEAKAPADALPTCHIFPANMKTRALRMLLVGPVRSAKVRAHGAVPAVYVRSGPRDRIRTLRSTWRPTKPVQAVALVDDYAEAL